MEGFYFSTVSANGINHRIASTVPNLLARGKRKSEEQRGCRNGTAILVMFLHGFPESWYSWRHQLRCLKNNNMYLGVAPDMRGYGSTAQPVDVQAYTQPVLARDVVEIADALGYQQFIVVGHDFGAQLAWHIALLYPSHLLGVFAMSVPYAGTPKAGWLTMLQERYGRCLHSANGSSDSNDKSKASNLNIIPREELEKVRFHYILHHNLPRAEEVYDRNCREALYRLYGYCKGCETEEGTPEYDRNGLMFPSTGIIEKDRSRALDATAAPGMWLRRPRPKQLPSWFTQQDLDYYVGEFERAGFLGALRWYQAFDINYEMMNHLLSQKDGSITDTVKSPAMFMIGDDDSVLQMFGGQGNLLAKLKLNVPNLVREPIFVKDCGHWIQQEVPELVNDILLEVLDDFASKHRHATTKMYSKF